LAHELSRGDFLKVAGGGAALLALGDREATAEGTNPIKIGLLPYYYADPANPGVQRGFNVFASQSGVRPYFYSGWTDPNRGHGTNLRDESGADIISVATNLNVHLTLNIEIWGTAEPPNRWTSLLDGTGMTSGGVNGDTYIANIRRHLLNYVNATGYTVPVRMFHEFNAPNSGWGGSDIMPQLWRRYVTILKGGDVNANLAAIGQAPLAVDRTIPVNNALRFVFSPLLRDDILVDSALLNTWWPGDAYVDQIGPDLYPKSGDAKFAVQMDGLNNVNTYANNKGMFICFPEFHWPAGEYQNGESTDSPENVQEALDWMINHKSRITFMSLFETWNNYCLFRLDGNPHPALKTMYKTYLPKPAFRGA
jgi:hypothetical protein